MFREDISTQIHERTGNAACQMQMMMQLGVNSLRFQFRFAFGGFVRFVAHNCRLLRSENFQHLFLMFLYILKNPFPSILPIRKILIIPAHSHHDNKF